MKQSKESLIIELAKIRQSHEEWVAGDEKRRKEFAKAFSWFQNKSSYNYQNGNPDPISPSWEQIFTEVGKLLASRNFMDFEGNISELECKLNNLEEKIRKEIHTNL